MSFFVGDDYACAALKGGGEHGGARQGLYLVLAGFAAIVAGFWRTFFSDPYSNDGWHIAHGVASTLWVLLLVTHSLLIGRGWHQRHRRLGRASVGLFVALIATGSYIVWIELRGDPDFPRDLRLSLVFLDIGFLALFVATYAAGLWFRQNRAVHGRLMGSTILIGLGPALGRLYAQRIPAVHGLAGALTWAMWTIEAVLVIAILLELRARRVWWPFPPC